MRHFVVFGKVNSVEAKGIFEEFDGEDRTLFCLL
jgi:hypothetical protein